MVFAIIDKYFMWIVSFFPVFVTHAFAIIGACGIIAGTLTGYFPIINKYKLPIQIVSVLMLGFGLYLEGGLVVTKEWETKVATLEVRVAKAETAAANATAKVVTKLVYKTQVIKQKGDSVIEYIDREVTKYDKTCPIPDSVVKAHNAAAANEVVDPVVITEHNALAKTPTKLVPK